MRAERTVVVALAVLLTNFHVVEGAKETFSRSVVDDHHLHRQVQAAGNCETYTESLDCNGCVQAGCFWLPELALCLEQAIPLGGYEDTDFVQACQEPQNRFNDPLYSTESWVYEMINLEEVWDAGVTGSGIHIRINDDGVDGFHPELADRFDFDSSCVGGAFPVGPMDYRGTALAGIAAGGANNNECAVGIAPGATTSSCNILHNPSLGGEYYLDQDVDKVDISSTSVVRSVCGNSIDRRILQDTPCPFADDSSSSPCSVCIFPTTELAEDCKNSIIFYCQSNETRTDTACLDYLDYFVSCNYNALTTPEQEALNLGITYGRGGRGVIYVYAAGEMASLGVDTNMDGWLNSRFTISVGSVGKQGELTESSTPGAALFITAPGGNIDYQINHVTANMGGGCREVGYGTEFATPIVSGVVALMLEVNPRLWWRDVQGILASTAQKVNPEHESWTTNGVGNLHSSKYGFGVVDASAAVELARTWEPLGSEQQLYADSGTLDFVIMDDSSQAIISSVSVSPSEDRNDFSVESVVVYLDVFHFHRGDLKVVLTSPEGTSSILHPGNRPEAGEQLWKLMTLQSWGESPFGNWTLTVTDEMNVASEEFICRDRPFMGNTTFPCRYFGGFECRDGVVVNADVIDATMDEDGSTAAENCCICGGGIRSDSAQEVLASWQLLIYGSSSSSSTIAPQQCMWEDDTCPFKSDGICDAGVNCPLFTDCYDCDNCQEYSFQLDCEGCVQSGCYWLPGADQCAGYPLDVTLDLTYTAADYVRTCQAKSNFFDDPLYTAQRWSYSMIKVEQVWEQGITGDGVHIRINDNGVDATHPEFSAKFDNETACLGGFMPSDVEPNYHGTAMASIAAGSANDECAVGIAPNAIISACNVQYVPSFSGEWFLDLDLEKVDIMSNSIGTDGCSDAPSTRRKLDESICLFADGTEPCEVCDFTSELTEDCESAIIRYCRTNYVDDQNACAEYLDLFVACEFNALSDAEQQALVKGIMEGRQGKGVVYLFASGNGLNYGNNLNFEPWMNSRFTITVGAVGKFGEKTSYSVGGAALFISGPGSTGGVDVTNVVAQIGGGCRDAGFGTSFACPVVAGVVALMLEANPDLGWRDVQSILANTAQKIHPNDDSWTMNAAGLWHSYMFGFGLVDAHAAVEAAKTWQNYGIEQQLFNASGLINATISDYPGNGITSSLSIIETDTDKDFRVESVVVYVELDHASRGDLQIVLASPQRTLSILSPGRRPENKNTGELWKLMTVRSRGESPFGPWTITVTDDKAGNVEECVDLPFQGNGLPNRDCPWFEDKRCFNGTVLKPNIVEIYFDEEGNTAENQCCACGGGVNGTTISNSLISWRIMVYGHSSNFTNVITDFPTRSPTVGPSDEEVEVDDPDATNGVIAPTAGPSIRESEVPTFISVQVPTATPTEGTQPASNQRATDMSLSSGSQSALINSMKQTLIAVACLCHYFLL